MEKTMTKGRSEGKIKLFLKSVAWGLVAFMTSVLPAWSIYHRWSFLFTGIVVLIWFFVAPIYVDYLVTKLYQYLERKRATNRLTATLGNIDRIIYALGVVFSQYSVVAVWLSIKIAQRIIRRSKLDDEEAVKQEGEKVNVFLIGNTISLAFGLLGGFLAKFLMYMQACAGIPSDLAGVIVTIKNVVSWNIFNPM